MGLPPLWLPLVSPPTLPLPPSISLVLTLLPPPLLPEATLLPDAMSPTLPELSMLPRGRLRLRLMLMLTPTCTTADSDTLDMADTLDTDTLGCHTPDTDTPVWATTMVLDTLTTPESSPPLPLPPSISEVLLLLPPPLWPEDMLLPDGTVPTLLE